MAGLNRRQAIVSLAAAAVGVGAAAAPELLGLRNGSRANAAHHNPKKPKPPPDPGYAHGQPMQAVRNPVHNLRDLTPPAPPNAIALTIDDGPHPRYTPMMLDLLAEFGVVATFNLIGRQVLEFPAVVRRIADSGHQLADHTVNHPLNIVRLPPATIQKEIAEAHDQIAQTTGRSPRFFRSPGGAWSPAVVETATAHGMICVDWGIDPRDWARPGTARISEAMLKAQAADVLLCHDGGGDRTQTIEALRSVIPALKQRGLTFVAL